ncbi:zinc finger protein 782-like [Ruditapes philippinarum]|uniref:zinc finger protein 782-like n=1 Tax=Ruditapes philippinarum TaxID=129788 RepID=UPI00295C3A47|nr:zinc finger protein 782-like [Ruditapes philippinarum]XP_060590769.1 zinc finger protein 782-like [Ruditapes philippinarum]XP_060590770.1 zinc finger protein 782-like [Ruditapes philippinarum]
MEEENYAGIQSEFEYTVELDNTSSDIENSDSPLYTKMVHGKENSDSKDGVEIEEDCPSGRTDVVDKSDYVYVLEPDSIKPDNLKESTTDESEKESDKEPETCSIQIKNEFLGAIDLTGSNKRKRKSNIDSALSHILKTKTVNGQNETALEESHSEETHANKVQILEKNVRDINQNGLPMNAVYKTPNNIGIKSELCITPKAAAPTLSTPNTSSGRKNRRKRSVPVRCERSEEVIDDIKEIMEEYGAQPDVEMKTEKPTLAERASDIAPLDLTPKSFGNSEISAVPKDAISPMDLTASSKNKAVKKGINTEPKPENAQPVDLSKPSPSSTPNNELKNGFTNGGLLPQMMPNTQIDPLQMRQLFETVYKMQAQFPNQNLVQAQLMQFHALMQNAMLHGGLMQGNGVKKEHIKNDKNDNIIKTEPGLTNNMMTNELQFNLELMHKNGLIQNNFAPTFNGAVPGSPFTMNQTNHFKSRSAKKKSKDLSPLINESSLDSVQLESSTPLVGLDVKQGPEQVLDTLSKFFPVVPAESLPKTQLGDDSNSVRFFVKDNEQIRVIVDSLLQVGVLDFDEQQIHGTEPVYKYICRVCCQTFFHVEHLTKHIKKSHIVKKYQCSECDRSFHDAGNYRQHMRVHDETDIPYECPECKRRFRHKCTLKVHMRIHTGEKPFKCEICDATFKISSGLQTHMRKHTGETPYACEFCDLRFKCQSNLKQHLFQHTQVRPFPCDICGKTYSRKSIRDAHLLTHTKDSIKNEHVKKWIDSMPAQALSVGGNE